MLKFKDNWIAGDWHDPSGVYWIIMVCEPVERLGNTSPDEPKNN